MSKKPKEKRKYYDFFEDVKKYPDAVVYLVVSLRSVGKTYSFLKDCYQQGIKCIYMKRTIDDVETICTGDEFSDINPYKPINRDIKSNIKPKLLRKGVGYFKQVDKDEHAQFVSYLAALNALKTIRGVDFSDADYCVLDETCPTLGDLSIRHNEGEQLLDCYLTFNRDREDRGLPPIKLVLFSNSDNVICPIYETLEIVNPLVDLAASGEAYYYDPERLIMIHYITDKEIPPTEAQKKKGMYRTMLGTDWHAKAYTAAFVHNDFSKVTKKSIAHARCLMKCTYNHKDIYIYENQDNGALIFSKIKHQVRTKYDFSIEGDRVRFLHYENQFVRNAIMNDKAHFETFTMYDLFFNFTKKFNLR